MASLFLTSALDRSERSASHPDRFIPWKVASGTHCIGGWLDPRAGLHAVEKIEISCPVGNRNRAVQPVAPTELFRLEIALWDVSWAAKCGD
jgi:hypothetical protein